ncbi:MAG: PepSY domain-containing protein [Verrucomicrobiia bacterium]
MKNIVKYLALAVIPALAVMLLSTNIFAANKEGKEVKIKPEDCPKAVLDAVKEIAKDGTIVEIEKEVKNDGAVVYEVEVKRADGKKIEIKVAADGKVIKTENDDDEDESADDNDDDSDNNEKEK